MVGMVAARCCSCCMLSILAEDTTTELEVASKDGFSREKSLEVERRDDKINTDLFFKN